MTQKRKKLLKTRGNGTKTTTLHAHSEYQQGHAGVDVIRSDTKVAVQEEAPSRAEHLPRSEASAEAHYSGRTYDSSPGDRDIVDDMLQKPPQL